jgi:hypothetical protein
MTERIGDYFVRLEMLSFEQAERIMEVQKRQPERRFGEIALELGYIDSTDLETYEQYCLSGECP